MNSHTSLVAQQTRLSEWAEMVRNCQNRPQGMKIEEWCQQHDITKASYYWRLRKVREALSNVHDLVKQISTKSKRRFRFLIELRLLDLFRNFLRFRNIFFKCSQEVHCVQEKYDDQYILDNLKRLSDKLECCIDK